MGSKLKWFEWQAHIYSIASALRCRLHYDMAITNDMCYVSLPQPNKAHAAFQSPSHSIQWYFKVEDTPKEREREKEGRTRTKHNDYYLLVCYCLCKTSAALFTTITVNNVLNFVVFRILFSCRCSMFLFLIHFLSVLFFDSVMLDL